MADYFRCLTMLLAEDVYDLLGAQVTTWLIEWIAEEENL